MKPHVKIYLNHFGYTIADFIPCERCNAPSVDIHHLNGRGKGKDVIENLIALCRDYHNQAHGGLLDKENLTELHKRNL